MFQFSPLVGGGLYTHCTFVDRFLNDANASGFLRQSYEKWQVYFARVLHRDDEGRTGTHHRSFRQLVSLGCLLLLDP